MGSDGPRRDPAGGGTHRGAAPRPGGGRPGPRPPHGAPGTSDPWAARARELHRKAAEADEQAARYRHERDLLIHRLRAQDPARWSYTALAAAIGCSRELIALVTRRGR